MVLGLLAKHPVSEWRPTLLKCMGKRGQTEESWQGTREAVRLWQALGSTATGYLQEHASGTVCRVLC